MKREEEGEEKRCEGERGEEENEERESGGEKKEGGEKDESEKRERGLLLPRIERNNEFFLEIRFF